jgi:O-antigen ligase
MLLRLAKFFLYITPLAVVIVSASTLFPFIVGKYVFFRTAVDLALIFFLLAAAFDPESAAPYIARLKRLLKTPLGISIIVFAAVFTAAALLGARPAFSFWSNFERGEGAVQILHLAAYFFLLASLFERKNWERFFWVSISSGVLMVLYGVGAGLGSKIMLFVGPQFGADAYRFQGSIGNPAYVAAYLIFQLFFAVYLFLNNPPYFKNWRSYVLLAASGLFAWAFLLAATRGAFLGLVSGIMVSAGVIAYARERWRKKLILGVIILAFLVIGMILLRNNSLVKKIPGSRIFDISFNAETFSTRRIMWHIAYEGWKARPLLGWGPENFLMVFDRHFDTRYFVPSQGFGAWFDRAHSIIFDYLAETGILGLLAYLSIFVSLVWSLIKRKKAEGDYAPRNELGLRAAVLGLIAAYLVQGVILFDVLTIYQNLFIILAFTAATWTMYESGDSPAWKPGIPQYSFAGAGVILAFAGIYFSAFLPYGKAIRFINAERATASISTEEQFEAIFRVPLDFPSPVGDEETVKYLSNDIMGILPQVKDQETARRLTAFIEPHLWQDDIRHILVGAQLHYILWHNFGAAADFKATEDYFLKAHEIAPQLPQPLYGLAQLYKEKGDQAKLTAELKEIKSLWPDAKVDF